MLDELHETLRRLIYQEGRISPLEVDVRFEAPTRQFAERLTRPTLSFFLFDLQENTELRQGGYETTRGNGYSERRQPPRRIDLHFMVSAISSEIVDEHLLLWRALATLLRHQTLPDELLPESLRGTKPPLTTRVGQPDEGNRVFDIWGGIDAELRPALHYVLTTPLDLDIAIRSPLVLTRTAQYLRVHEPDEPREIGLQVGGYVRDRRGSPLVGVAVLVRGSAAEPSLTEHDGSFRLRGLEPGTVTLELTRPDGSRQDVEIEVPGDAYEIVWK